MRNFLAALGFLLYSTTAFAVATTPAVNAPMVSMAGGTAPSLVLSTTGTTVIATTSETSILQSSYQGPGTTITGGVPYAGNRFHVYASGIVTTPIGGGTATLKMKWGSIAVATLSGATLSISLTNTPWWFDGYCNFTAISGTASSSTMRCTGLFMGASAVPIIFTGTSTSVDTTTNQLFDVTWTWSSVTTQTVTSQDATVEILY